MRSLTQYHFVEYHLLSVKCSVIKNKVLGHFWGIPFITCLNIFVPEAVFGIILKFEQISFTNVKCFRNVNELTHCVLNCSDFRPELQITFKSAENAKKKKKIKKIVNQFANSVDPDDGGSL